jgi:hypothetical protein
MYILYIVLYCNILIKSIYKAFACCFVRVWTLIFQIRKMENQSVWWHISSRLRIFSDIILQSLFPSYRPSVCKYVIGLEPVNEFS